MSWSHLERHPPSPAKIDIQAPDIKKMCENALTIDFCLKLWENVLNLWYENV